MRLPWPLINLGLLFIIPIIAASYLLGMQSSITIPSVEHGNFISPPVKLPLKNIQYLSGTTTDNKWSIVYVRPAECTTTCHQMQQVLQNLHRALGAHKERVSIVAMPSNDLEITENNLLIVNPQGLYIMQYKDLSNPSGLLKDMRRLLKYSHA